MNERLTIQDLIDLLAAKHSMTKKDAEAFVKEFFLLIEQALENERTVKIKGLGTFKLVDVDSRESVNVNTGERFKIKGHTKVSFTPDTNLRDTINKPFAHFETVILNDNTILDDTPLDDSPVEEVEEEEAVEEMVVQTEEIKNNVLPIKDSHTASEIVENVIEEKGVIDKVDEPVFEHKTIEEDPVEVQPSESLNQEEVTAEAIIAQELQKAKLKPIASNVILESNSTFKKEKSPVPYLITIIIIVLFLCGGVVLFIYFPDMFTFSPKKNTIEVPLTVQPVEPEAVLPDTVVHKDTVLETIPNITREKEVIQSKPIVNKEINKSKTENKTVQKQPSPPVYPDSASYKITGTKTNYTIKEGETLTRVSLRFYGTKAMWPYIVKHNPNVIKNPNHVPYGTTIKIPELTKE